MGKSFRLPNSFGSVYKLSGNRRRPWAVAKTFGWDDKGKQIKKIIGYAETKKDGLQILMEYNQNPLTKSELVNLTSKDVFYRWFNTIDNMSDTNRRNYKSIFENHCKNIQNIKVRDLKTYNFQECIDECNRGFTTKKYIQLIASQIYKYCNIQLDMSLRSNFSEGLICGIKPKSDMHLPFTHDEIKILWNNIHIPYVNTIILTVYTGLRPSELLKIEIEKINIEERYMIGGIKTKAGIDRKIPIHEDIVPIIESLIRINKKFLIEKDGRQLLYRHYLDIYTSLMNKLGMDHKPHDGRHTLATELDNLGANEVCTKMILGHAIDDITKGVYTHKEFKQLISTINLVKFC